MAVTVVPELIARYLDQLQTGTGQEKAGAAAALSRIRIIERGTIQTRGTAARPAPETEQPLPVDVLPPMLDALGDSSPDVRREVAAALGEWGDERVVPRLVELLDGTPGDEDTSVRRACIYALRVIGGMTAVQSIADAARKDTAEEVRWDAIRALAELQGAHEAHEEATPGAGTRTVRTRGSHRRTSGGAPATPLRSIAETLQAITEDATERSYLRREAQAALSAASRKG